MVINYLMKNATVYTCEKSGEGLRRKREENTRERDVYMNEG